jgi:hypothetical protein
MTLSITEIQHKVIVQCQIYEHCDNTYKDFTYKGFTYKDFTYKDFTYIDFTYKDFTYKTLPIKALLIMTLLIALKNETLHVYFYLLWSEVIYK